MPRWDFQCPECGRVYELAFRTYNHMSEHEGVICCDECFQPLVRLPSAPNFKLVGSGFYVNDYKDAK